ncbi:MAG: type II secretion system protein [Clostridiales bacterium]|nr:type II secretion system protein [Clostridiales bacterium]
MSKKISGFTLIELVVTIAVVAIMSSLCVSIVFSTSALRAEKEDKMALGEMNNIFVSEWGAESYAYPQTAADIKQILSEHGYQFAQPRTKGAEWWFDTSNGRICMGVIKGDKLSLDYDSRVVDLVPNDQIITADGFLPSFVYMGEQYRGIIDNFLRVEVDGDIGVAQQQLNSILNDDNYPMYIRKSLATLAENALFVGNNNVLSFAQSEENLSGIYDFKAQSDKDSTVAVFTVDSLVLNDQLQNCYIKSLYIPSDVEVNEIDDKALEGSWIQRILINKDMPILTDNKIYNYNNIDNYDEKEVVPVLRKYYPSELPIYQLDERRIDKFLKIYSAGWHDGGLENFASYFSNELIHKAEIETLNREFYKLRPYERKYVLSCRQIYKKFDLSYNEQILETIKTLEHNKDVLEDLYNKLTVTQFAQEKLLQSKFLPEGDMYSLQDKLSEIVSEIDSEANAWVNFDKLFIKDDIFAVGAVKLGIDAGKFTAVSKGEGSITLTGVLQDENNDNHKINFPFLVQGAYDSIEINSLILEAREITRGDINAAKHTIKSEYYGTFDESGKPCDITLNVKTTGDYIYDKEKWVIKEVKVNGSAISLNSNTQSFNIGYAENNDITVTVTICSYLDQSVTAVIENIPFKGNTSNIFAFNIDTVNNTMSKKRNVALHSDATVASQSTWTVPEGCFVYGNGHTYTNKAKSAEDSAWASAHGEFRFPAVVTVYGTVENLKIVAQIPNLAYRFGSVAYAEDGETTTYNGAAHLITYVKGEIKNNYWTQTNKSSNSVYLLSSRLAAVRVYGSGALDTCVVEGGQYGIHLIGSKNELNGKLNLDNVWVNNSLAANIYVSDYDGVMQNLALNNVHTYNAPNMDPAFPILVEPKVNAASSNTNGYKNVKGYGIILKYYYSLLEEKLSIDINDFYTHNPITYSKYYDLLLQYTIQNMQVVDNEFLKYLWVESKDYFEVDLKLILLHLANVDTGANISGTLVNGDFKKIANNSINMPIIYGEQYFWEIYDQVLCISDKGQNTPPSSLIGSLHKIDKRNTFDSVFKYQKPARGACGINARGTNEVALSFYNVSTVSGGTWSEPNLAIK